MMKFILFFLFSLFTFSLIAQDVADGSSKAGGQYQLVEGLKGVASSLPAVQKSLKECQTDQQSNPGKDINDCLLQKLMSLPKNEQTQLMGQFEELKKVNPDASDSISYTASSAYKGFRAYIAKKLNDEYFGGEDQFGDKKNNVTQKSFFEMYKVQLGDNVLTYASWFCLHFDANRMVVPSDLDERREVRTYNMSSLSQFNEVRRPPTTAAPTTSGGTAPAPTQQNQGTASFTSCLTMIPYICDRTILKLGNQEIDFSRDDVFGRSSSSDIENTRSKACIVQRYIKEIRQSMALTDEVIKCYSGGYTGDDAGEKCGNLQKLTIETGLNKPVLGTGADGTKKGLNEVISLSSQEVVNESELGKSLMSEEAMAKKCVENPGTPECQKLLYTAADQQAFQQQIVPAYQAQTAATVAKIRSMDQEALKKFLEREGRKEGEIATIMKGISGGTGMKGVLDEIARRYANERTAIIKEMAAKLKNLGVTPPPSQSVADSMKGSVNTKNVAAVMGNIAKETEERRLALASIYHYKNIVTAYLPVTDSQTGKSSTNTRAAIKELGSSAFNPQNQGDPLIKNLNLDSNYFKNLQEKTKAQIGKAQGSDDSNVQLEVDTINRAFLGAPQTQRGIQVTPVP